MNIYKVLLTIPVEVTWWFSALFQAPVFLISKLWVRVPVWAPVSSSRTLSDYLFVLRIALSFLSANVCVKHSCGLTTILKLIWVLGGTSYRSQLVDTSSPDIFVDDSVQELLRKVLLLYPRSVTHKRQTKTFISFQ